MERSTRKLGAIFQREKWRGKFLIPHFFVLKCLKNFNFAKNTKMSCKKYFLNWYTEIEIITLINHIWNDFKIQHKKIKKNREMGGKWKRERE